MMRMITNGSTIFKHHLFLTDIHRLLNKIIEQDYEQDFRKIIEQDYEQDFRKTIEQDY